MLLMNPNTYIIIMGHACTLKNPLVCCTRQQCAVQGCTSVVGIGCHICWTCHEIRDAPTKNGYKH